MKMVNCIKELCVGCHQCETACAVEHSNSGSVFDAVAEPVRALPRIKIKLSKDKKWSIPLKCRHCNPAPCSKACIAGAIRRVIPTGHIIIDEYRCTGCKACIAACPFGAIQFGISNRPGNFHHVAIKCDECIDRNKVGKLPVCVESCKTGALIVSSLNQELKEKKRQANEIIFGSTAGSSDAPSDYRLFFSLKNTIV